MLLNWKAVEGTQAQEPPELEVSAKRVVMRRNIEQVEKTTEEGTISVYTYEEAILTPAEYDDYVAETQSPAIQEIMQALSDLQADVALM